MKKTLFHLLSFSIILFLPSQAFSQENISGTWIFAVETDMGSGNPTFIIEQGEEGKLSGTYQGQLGEAPITGKIEGNEVHLEFSIQGNLIEYDGELKEGKIVGTAALGTMASGTFVGTKSEE